MRLSTGAVNKVTNAAEKGKEVAVGHFKSVPTLSTCAFLIRNADDIFHTFLCTLN